MQEIDNYDDILSSTSQKFIGRLKVVLQELKRIDIYPEIIREELFWILQFYMTLIIILSI